MHLVRERAQLPKVPIIYHDFLSLAFPRSGTSRCPFVLEYYETGKEVLKQEGKVHSKTRRVHYKTGNHREKNSYVRPFQGPVPDFERLSQLVPLFLCPGTRKELLSICPEKLHCPVGNNAQTMSFTNQHYYQIYRLVLFLLEISK